jgi:hypothetical protein
MFKEIFKPQLAVKVSTMCGRILKADPQAHMVDLNGYQWPNKVLVVTVGGGVLSVNSDELGNVSGQDMENLLAIEQVHRNHNMPTYNGAFTTTPNIEVIFRKFYNEIKSNSRVGEYKELLELVGKEIDKLEK